MWLVQCIFGTHPVCKRYILSFQCFLMSILLISILVGKQIEVFTNIETQKINHAAAKFHQKLVV